MQSEQVLDVVPVEPGCTAGVIAVVQLNEYILECWLGAVLREATASADPRVLSGTEYLERMPNRSSKFPRG
ncbi:hypothetical protein FBY31_0328 [Arthrobacter sp. SLBN-100]|nr:hypothetical protein FBY31_0328 [Arthrobacter sp. SLBN-100]